MCKIKCSFCGKEVPANRIHGFFPEDDSFICKSCCGKPFQKNTFHKKAGTTKTKQTVSHE